MNETLRSLSPSPPRALNWPLLRLGRLQRFRAAFVPGMTLLVIILAGLFAPLLAPYDPNAIDMQIALAGPDWAHPLGADQLGRDHLSRLLYGGQATLLLSGFGTLVIIAIGLLVGVVSGYIGGFVDTLVSTILTVLLALPNLLLTLAILGILGPGAESLLIALIGAGWVGHARVFRSAILALREQAFVESARAMGFSPLRIMVRHLLPNLLPTVVILATLDIGALLLLISSLSFLGLGAQPPTADWGVMLNDARPFFTDEPLLVVAPGFLITVVVLTSNMLGDALRDVVDLKR